MLTKARSQVIEKLRNLSQELREYHDFKTEWVDKHSDDWQNSEEGLDWVEHLDAIENIIDQIEDLPYS